MRYAMIMAGGAGTRLWPVSRRNQPKQLVPFIDRDDDRVSLLRIAVERLEGLIPPERCFICTNEAYRDEIKASIPGMTDDRILGEPEGRDTVNAVGFGAAVIGRLDPEATFAVLTADHLIEPEAEFRRLLDVGYSLAEEDERRLVTFSIKPTYAATGFGYVERGGAIQGSDDLAYRVERFVEKPSAERAQAYLESGAFGWNSGMFVWRASTIMDCLARYKPESHAGLVRIADAWGTDEQQAVLNQVYPELPKISVDYAVMEPATREQSRTAGRESEAESVKVCTVLMDLKWLDVGSWPSYGETLDADRHGNRGSGDVVFHDARNSLVVNHGSDHLVATLGCEDMIVIHTDRATLVMPRKRAEELKLLHAKLPDDRK
ncbi:MAG: mannose-1-phosphate guanylyltransferase [Phycisphaerales bacterium]